MSCIEQNSESIVQCSSIAGGSTFPGVADSKIDRVVSDSCGVFSQRLSKCQIPLLAHIGQSANDQHNATVNEMKLKVTCIVVLLADYVHGDEFLVAARPRRKGRWENAVAFNHHLTGHLLSVNDMVECIIEVHRRVQCGLLTKERWWRVRASGKANRSIRGNGFAPNNPGKGRNALHNAVYSLRVIAGVPLSRVSTNSTLPTSYHALV